MPLLVQYIYFKFISTFSLDFLKNVHVYRSIIGNNLSDIDETKNITWFNIQKMKEDDI